MSKSTQMLESVCVFISCGLRTGFLHSNPPAAAMPPPHEESPHKTAHVENKIFFPFIYLTRSSLLKAFPSSSLFPF